MGFLGSHVTWRRESARTLSGINKKKCKKKKEFPTYLTCLAPSAWLIPETKTWDQVGPLLDAQVYISLLLTCGRFVLYSTIREYLPVWQAVCLFSLFGSEGRTLKTAAWPTQQKSASIHHNVIKKDKATHTLLARQSLFLPPSPLFRKGGVDCRVSNKIVRPPAYLALQLFASEKRKSEKRTSFFSSFSPDQYVCTLSKRG